MKQTSGLENMNNQGNVKTKEKVEKREDVKTIIISGKGRLFPSLPTRLGKLK